MKQSNNLWQAVSAVLFILLVIALLTPLGNLLSVL